jgi:hypothetical protein
MKKIVISIILLNFSVLAFSQNIGSFEYRIIGEGANRTITIISYNNSVIKNVVIPDTINDIPVTEIGPNAFSNRQLTNVVLPQGLITIGKDAFADNYLQSIVIPNSVKKIESRAFVYYEQRPRYRTNVVASDAVPYVRQIVIGTNVVMNEDIISGSSFTYCYNDNNKRGGTYISLPGGSWQYFELDNDDFIFELKLPVLSSISIVTYKGRDTKVIIPNKISNIPVAGIGRGAFNNKNITEVSIGSEIKTIEDFAFANNSLNKITIGYGVKFSDNVFGIPFYRYYYNNGQKAGQYFFQDNSWQSDFQ